MCLSDGALSASLWFCVVLVVGGSASAHAQAPIQRDRLHLPASGWQNPAKTAPGIRVNDAVRLQSGAAVGTITSPVFELPFAVNAVGLHWDATVPERTRLKVELRSSLDGSTWTRWVAPTHPQSISTPPEGVDRADAFVGDTAAGPILTEPRTRFVQVRLTFRGVDASSPALRRLSLSIVNSMAGPLPPRDGSRPRAAPDTSKPRIYSRSEWGAQPPRQAYRHERATHLAIHHTATTSAGAADTWDECAAAVRAIQDFHMNTREWIDIGYNYLVCQTGALFQGREDDNPTRDVVAAHDGYNDGSVGTAGLGYFHPPENQQPTPSLIESFVDLFAWLAQRRRIDPQGSSYYAGYGQAFRNIYGHRDIKATACPGDLFYAERSTIVNRVSDRVELPPAVTAISENIPNPAQTRTRFELALSMQTPVTLRVYDLLGRHVATRHYGSFPPGEHTVPIRTARWATGAYPYRLVTDERTGTGLIHVVR